MANTNKNSFKYIAMSAAAIALVVISGIIGRCSRNGQVQNLQETNVRLENDIDSLRNTIEEHSNDHDALTDSLNVVTEKNQALTDSLDAAQKRLADCEAKKKPCPCRPATKPAPRKPAPRKQTPQKPAPAKPAPVTPTPTVVEQPANTTVTINNGTGDNNTVIIGNNNTVVINEEVKTVQDTIQQAKKYKCYSTRAVFTIQK